MIGIVSGSGIDLRNLLRHVTGESSFTDELPFAIGALYGHERTFVRGFCGEREVILQCGRLHFYEGHSYEAVVSTVDAMHRFGVRTIILTNVSGGLRAHPAPGAIVAVNEILTWPFVRWRDRPERISPDFLVDGCDGTGVYCWMHGPSYETAAEIRLLQELGGDVVGMSTAPEIARCRQLGMRSAVVSVITNSCCTAQVLTHEDVVRVAQAASARLIKILRKAIAS